MLNINKLLTQEDLKQDVILKKEGNIFYLILNKKTNNFNFDFIRKINDKLDIIENSEGPACLVTTSTNKRYFSTGLDLKFVLDQTQEDLQNFFMENARMAGRFLSLKIPSIALINGYAIAGGCLLAMNHDYRIMKTGSEIISMNEIDIGIPIPPFVMQVLADKVQKQVLRDLTMTGKKYTTQEALENGIVDMVVEEKDMFMETKKLADQLSKFGANKQCYGRMKEELYRDAIQVCFKYGLVSGVNYRQLPNL